MYQRVLLLESMAAMVGDQGQRMDACKLGKPPWMWSKESEWKPVVSFSADFQTKDGIRFCLYSICIWVEMQAARNVGALEAAGIGIYIYIYI
jgi:succinyl-CoA synthetase alpha subunit